MVNKYNMNMTKENINMENKTKPTECKKHQNEEPLNYVEEFVQMMSFTMEGE